MFKEQAQLEEGFRKGIERVTNVCSFACGPVGENSITGKCVFS